MPKPTPLRLATFNANSIRSRLPIVLDWLAQMKPDLLAVQETKAVDADFPRQAFLDVGYHAVFRGEKSYNGVAFITRGEPEEVVFGFEGDKDRDETRLARTMWHGVAVINTYVPQGRELESEYYAYKLRWFARLRELFAARYSPKEPVVWLGDLNVAPTELDLHSPKTNKDHVCFHEDVRRALDDVMAWGFSDLFRKHHPNEPGRYSFWDYRLVQSVERNVGWRVDHILGTAPAAAACVACEIDRAPRLREKPSDHTFVYADLKL